MALTRAARTIERPDTKSEVPLGRSALIVDPMGRLAEDSRTTLMRDADLPAVNSVATRTAPAM